MIDNKIQEDGFPGGIGIGLDLISDISTVIII
jgi:hypothetical protein